MAIPTIPLFTKIILTASIPAIVTELRLSATHSIIVLVAAEILGSDSGLEFLIFEAQDSYDAPAMYSGIIILSMLGLLLNYLIVQFEKRVTYWQPKVEDI